MNVSRGSSSNLNKAINSLIITKIALIDLKLGGIKFSELSDFSQL